MLPRVTEVRKVPKAVIFLFCGNGIRLAVYPSNLFVRCPRCGGPRALSKAPSPFVCADCGLRYYFNPSVAVAAFIQRSDGRWLFIRRAKEPSKGLLSVAGGFVEIGEKAEAALAREVFEEIGVGVQDLRFLESQPNQYDYLGVTYPVLDLYFLARTIGNPHCAQPEEVAGIEWRLPSEIRLEDLAFQSLRAAWTNHDFTFFAFQAI